MMLPHFEAHDLEYLDGTTLLQSDRSPTQRKFQPKPDLGPSLQFRIEVWRESKKKRRQTRVVKL
jgi:hypothetical protein